jgi:hypothetical protein
MPPEEGLHTPWKDCVDCRETGEASASTCDAVKAVTIGSKASANRMVGWM